MVQFEVLESKLVYRDPHSRWHLSAQILLDTGEIYYVLTHSSNDREQQIYMSQYMAEDLKEFLRHWQEKILRHEPPIESTTGNYIFFYHFYF